MNAFATVWIAVVGGEAGLVSAINGHIEADSKLCIAVVLRARITVVAHVIVVTLLARIASRTGNKRQPGRFRLNYCNIVQSN